MANLALAQLLRRDGRADPSSRALDHGVPERRGARLGRVVVAPRQPPCVAARGAVVVLHWAGHGERSRSQLPFKSARTENAIKQVNFDC